MDCRPTALPPCPHSSGKRVRRLLASLLITFLIVSTPSAAQDTAQSDAPRLMSLGAGPVAGTYFRLANAIAGAVSNPPGTFPCEKGGSCGVPGLIVSVRATEGSRSNLEDLHRGTLDAALVQGDMAYWAYKGTGPFRGSAPKSGLRALAMLHAEAVHVVVSQKSPVQTLVDLRGKRVAIGPKGSGSHADAQLLLAGVGLDPNAYTAVPLSVEQAAPALIEGGVDALIAVGGAPLPSLDQLFSMSALRLLPLPEAVTAALSADYPFLVPVTLPAGIYAGTPATPTLSVRAAMVVTDSMEDALAQAITQALWHETNRATLAAGHPLAQALSPETATRGMVLPMHRGAEAHYKNLLGEDWRFVPPVTVSTPPAPARPPQRLRAQAPEPAPTEATPPVATP